MFSSAIFIYPNMWKGKGFSKNYSSAGGLLSTFEYPVDNGRGKENSDDKPAGVQVDQEGGQHTD